MEKMLPNIVFWETTKKCNLRCIHCSGEAGVRAENELKTDEVKRVMDELTSLGMEELKLYGGEPLVREDLFEVSRYAKEINPKLKLSIYTNGTIMNSKILSEFKILKMDKVYLSIHDYRPEVHDAISCQPGSLDKVVETAEKLKDFRIKANYTISKLNIDGVEKTFEFSKNKLHAKGIGASILTNVGRALDHPELQLTREDIKYLSETISAQYKKYFGEVRERPCEAGVYRILLSATGEVYPCPLFLEEKFSAGNIRDKFFKEIWDNPAKGFLEVRQAVLSKGLNSGCRSRAYYDTGSLTGDDLYWENISGTRAE